MPRTVAIANRHPRLRLDRQAICDAVTLLDSQAAKFLGGCPSGELSLVFLTDPALAQIHGDFMNDPTSTDVITFDGNADALLAGEICVSADTAWKYAKKGLPPASRASSRDAAVFQTRFSTELTLYLVHGWLHLAGYDDLQPAKKRQMRAAEARAMKLLASNGAIPAFLLR